MPKIKIGQPPVHGHVAQHGIYKLEHTEPFLPGVLPDEEHMLHSREEVVMGSTAVDLGRDCIDDLHRIAHVLNFALDAILHAAALPLEKVFIIDGLIIAEPFDLLVNNLILESLHLCQQTLDST